MIQIFSVSEDIRVRAICFCFCSPRCLLPLVPWEWGTETQLLGCAGQNWAACRPQGGKYQDCRPDTFIVSTPPAPPLPTHQMPYRSSLWLLQVSFSTQWMNFRCLVNKGLGIGIGRTYWSSQLNTNCQLTPIFRFFLSFCSSWASMPWELQDTGRAASPSLMSEPLYVCSASPRSILGWPKSLCFP